MNILSNSLMLSAGVYLLKVILLSGLLYGYYRCFLRDRHFHRFNRCFLLCIPALSLAIPLIHLPLAGMIWPSAQDVPALQHLQSVTNGEWHETDALTGPSRWWTAFLSWHVLTAIVYLSVVLVSLFNFFRQLHYIRLLTKKYPSERIGSTRLFDTREPGTPFSFLQYIFWNEQLDLHSVAGKQILRHELSHVRQKHSLDLLLLKGLTTFCWINPFFHLISHEIKAVHEFLADSEAISEGDRYQYAEALVWQTVRNPPSSLLHLFFHSPIKRRINMITQLRTIRPTLFSRAMILPLLALLCCAFAAEHHSQPSLRIVAADRPMTVVIDAGHGGIDPGAISSNGVEEKTINLAIAEKIRQLSGGYNVQVLMTRESDELAGGRSSISESLHYRAEMANDKKADLFIAIHVDMIASKDVKGFSVFVAQDNPHYDQCVQLGAALTETFKKNYPTEAALKKRKEHIYVLDKTDMPAVLLLCGNLNNEHDLAFISREDNQEKVARDVLESIRKYAAARLGK
jgi:N-acetylmuramoyl-L-alanine amidase